MKKISLLLLFLQLTPSFAAEEKPVSAETAITSKISTINPICESCKFIVQKMESPWIKNQTLYEITTFDILPPPAWHAVVQKNGEIVILDHKKIEDWNRAISNEKISLDTDEKITHYAKFFLRMTMNQSEYLEKLLQSEIDRIEDKEKKKIEPQTKIVKSNERMQIIFYAGDSQGDLQQWNLILKPNGEILKVQERSY